MDLNNIIHLSHHGKYLGTRVLGQLIRPRAESILSKGETVVFDFSGVQVVSNSFSDEVFGKLVLHFGIDAFRNFTMFKDASSEIKTIINYSVRARS